MTPPLIHDAGADTAGLVNRTSRPTSPPSKPTTVLRWIIPAAAVALVLVSVVWGWRVQRDPNVKLGAAPLVGRWHIRFGWSLVPAALLAAYVSLRGTALVARLRFGWMIAASAAAAVGFTFLLAASDGLDHLLDPVVHRTEYWANLATLPAASTMLHHYGTTEFLLQYSVHAKGHPPAFLLLLKALAALGLARPWVAGALSYIGVGVGVAAVLLTVRRAGGEGLARRLAPFLVVAPYAVWMGTSADAFYAAIGAVGALLMVAAVTSSHAGRSRVQALGGGVVLGLLLFFTYGGVMFGLVVIVLTVGVGRHDLRRLMTVATIGVVGVCIVIGAFAAAGFWWFDGANVTRGFYWAGTAQFRPANYFLVGNLGAALIAIGPATIYGLSRLRDRRALLIMASGAVALLAADVSQYSKAEVERIWLLFYPWLMVGAIGVRRPRPWLAAQSALAIGLQLALVSKW